MSNRFVDKWIDRRRKQFLEEIRASVREAGAIKRGEKPASRKFKVTLGKPIEPTEPGQLKRYKIDLPQVLKNDDTVIVKHKADQEDKTVWKR